MTLVVLGIDALDPDLVDELSHPNLTLAGHRRIETIVSSVGEPSTHELWPTIITGLEPREHGLTLGTGGVAWSNPLFNWGSRIADHVLPDRVQNRIGAWLLNNADVDTFRTSAAYYGDRGISTVFDGVEAKPIGIPNYVVDPTEEDREHSLRKRLGEYMHFDPDAEHTHTAADRDGFYELCMEMVMVRLARTRRALRGGSYELVFGYTSGLDLIGHVAYDRHDLQERAYEEIDEFVGELRGDLREGDELLLVSDHGLQDGLHTEVAMVAATDTGLVAGIESVTDVRAAIDGELADGAHAVGVTARERRTDTEQSERVREQLQDLGYI